MNSIFMFFKLFNIRSVKFLLTNKIYVCTKLHIYGHEFNIYVLQIIYIYFTINVYILTSNLIFVLKIKFIWTEIHIYIIYINEQKKVCAKRLYIY